MAGLNIWKNEYHIVRVELKGPKSIKQLLQFDNALKQFVEENGGIVRILAKEKDKLAHPLAREGDRAKARPSKRSTRSKPKRSGRRR